MVGRSHIDVLLILCLVVGAQVLLVNPDAHRTLTPGDVERWRAVFGWKAEAHLP